MKIDRLFQVLVVTGISSVGAVACGDDNTPAPSGTGGAAGAAGAAGTAGAAGAGGGASCDCKPDTTSASWTDCNGCCCWLAPGATSPAPTPICGVEPCCAGKGPGR